MFLLNLAAVCLCSGGLAVKFGRFVRSGLYADDDMYFTLAYARSVFDAFRANGGTGEFLALGKVPGVPNGHALFEHVGMWEAAVAAYLLRIDGG